MKLWKGFVLVLILVSCAHYPDVRPGAEGVHKVSVVAQSKVEGSRKTLPQAQSFCDDKFGKTAAIVKESSQYTGDMKEKDYKVATRVGKLGKQLGLDTDEIIGNGYTVEMTFKCI